MALSRVLIIGNGLAGPALALSLARHSIRSTIFEIRPALGDGGGSISLAPNALRALDACQKGLVNRLRKRGYSYKRLAIYDEEGTLFAHVRQCVQEYDALRIVRAELHRGLMEACGEFGELIEVEYGARLEEMDEQRDGIVVSFEDGKQVKGDILIGADGIHSKTRRLLLGDDSPSPTYTGSCLINGFMPQTTVKRPEHWSLPSVLFTPVGLVGIWPVDSDASVLACGVSEELPERTRAEWTDYESSGEAARAAKAHYAHVKSEPLRSLVDGIKEGQIKLWAPYEMPDLPRWHGERVCLIGDAAHALPPNGQGAAMAFEDAAYLSRLLISPQALSAGFRPLFTHFQSHRSTRIARVRKLSHMAASTKSGTVGAWKWWAKKWAMRAFFAWKGGEMSDERIGAFDVRSESIDVRC